MIRGSWFVVRDFFALPCQMGSTGVPNLVSNTDGKEVRHGQQEAHRPLCRARVVRQHLRRAEVRNDAGRRPPPPSPPPWPVGLGAASPAAAAHVSWLVCAATAAPTAAAPVPPASLLVRQPFDGVTPVEVRERRGRVRVGMLPGGMRPEHFARQSASDQTKKFSFLLSLPIFVRI